MKKRNTKRRQPQRKAAASPARGRRGPKGVRGERGLTGPPGPPNHRYEGLAEKVEAIAQELRTQFQRFAQMQVQLDQVAQALQLDKRQRDATERLTPSAEREARAKPAN